jgi:pimeloyl-ACP methyl ester carboxylesterase
VVEDYLHALRVVPGPSQGAESDGPAADQGEEASKSLVVFTQSAHWPFMEEADVFVERLREHLSSFI